MIGSPFKLLEVTLAGAVAGQVTDATALLQRALRSASLYAKFVRAGGGTTTKAWVQTSLDGGLTWIDVACFAFATTTANRIFNLTDAAVTAIATPTDGTLADDTVVNGFLGTLWRVKLTTTGTYTGASSLTIWAS